MIMPHWSQARSPSSETGVIDALSSPRQPAAASERPAPTPASRRRRDTDSGSVSVISGYSKTTVLGPRDRFRRLFEERTRSAKPLRDRRSSVTRFDPYGDLPRALRIALVALSLVAAVATAGVRRRPRGDRALAGRLRRRGRTRALLGNGRADGGVGEGAADAGLLLAAPVRRRVQRRRIVRGDAGRRSNRTPVRLPDRRLRRDVRRRPTGDDRDRAVRSRVRRRVDAGGGGDLRRRERRPEPGGRDGRPVPRRGAAEAFAADHGGRAVDWETVRSRSFDTDSAATVRAMAPERWAGADGSRSPPSARRQTGSRSSSGRTRRRSRRRSRPRRRTRPSSSRRGPTRRL